MPMLKLCPALHPSVSSNPISPLDVAYKKKHLSLATPACSPAQLSSAELGSAPNAVPFPNEDVFGLILFALGRRAQYGRHSWPSEQ